MELIWHIPEEAKGRVIWSGAMADRRVPASAPGRGPGLQPPNVLFTAYILVLAGRFLRERAKASVSGLLFSEGALGLALQAAWAINALGPLFIAVASPSQEEKARAIGGGIVLEESDPGFTDRLKVETRSEGFPLVLIASTRGGSIRKALGAASALGSVFLLLPTREPTKVDLHSTINYKGLRVEGVDVFRGSSVVTDDELEMVIAKPALTTLADILFGAQNDNGAKSVDWFKITHSA